MDFVYDALVDGPVIIHVLEEEWGDSEEMKDAVCCGCEMGVVQCYFRHELCFFAS